MTASEDWQFPPGVTYLNHGSFGPSPRPVMEARNEWLRRIEREPMDFFVRQLAGLLEDAAGQVASFVGCRADDLIFVPNSTAGVNIVAANLPLNPGDEVLLTDHEYGAVVRIWGEYCSRQGARTVQARLPLPLQSVSDVVDAIVSRITDRTRLLVVSHVTSQSAAKLPVREICEAARSRGVRICIDAPHAPLHTEIDLRQIPCDYYAAGCHKWLSAPFGSGFLYVKARHKQGLMPNVISWGRSLNGSARSWKDEFHWPGTFDPSPFLTLPTAIDYFRNFGLDRFRNETHNLARFARQQLLELSGTEPLTTDSPEWYGSMVSVPFHLPSEAGFPGTVHPLQAWLWETHHIEIPVISWNNRLLVRVSCHLYNTREQIERLMTALREWIDHHSAE